VRNGIGPICSGKICNAAVPTIPQQFDLFPRGGPRRLEQRADLHVACSTASGRAPTQPLHLGHAADETQRRFVHMPTLGLYSGHRQRSW
jgi:hypothetical protein